MTTAKEIAEKHCKPDTVQAANLELDILRYLEYHWKKWTKEHEGSLECHHVFASMFGEGTTGGVRKCQKCGQIELSTLTSPV